MEVGPWRVDGKGGLKLIENGWEEYTHVVYGKLFAYPINILDSLLSSRSAPWYWLFVHQYR